MEQQSDNNLDELFQKAAEEYPLKTNNKNWDIVAAKLHPSPASLQTSKSKKWQYSALLFLLLRGSFFLVNSLDIKNITHGVSQQKSLTQKKDKSKQQIENKASKNQSIVNSDKNNNTSQGNDIINTNITSTATKPS